MRELVVVILFAWFCIWPESLGSQIGKVYKEILAVQSQMAVEAMDNFLGKNK